MLPFVKLPLLRLFYGFKQYRWNYHLDDWRSNIDVVMNELKQSGFVNRDVSSIMRISNHAYLHTGVGLSNASKQTQSIYKKRYKPSFLKKFQIFAINYFKFSKDKFYVL